MQKRIYNIKTDLTDKLGYEDEEKKISMGGTGLYIQVLTEEPL